MRRVTHLGDVRRWLTRCVEGAGLRATSRHTGLALSTLAKRCQRDDWTVEEIAKLAPAFGGRLFVEMPDGDAPRASTFYR